MNTRKSNKRTNTDDAACRRALRRCGFLVALMLLMVPAQPRKGLPTMNPRLNGLRNATVVASDRQDLPIAPSNEPQHTSDRHPTGVDVPKIRSLVLRSLHLGR